MPTIREIAEQCGVSVATVSNILNQKPGAGKKTRELVLAKVRELDYHPNLAARNLKTRSSRSIGVIVEDMTVFCVPEIVDGITQCCQENGYQVLLTNLRLYKRYHDSYYSGEDFFPEVHDEIGELTAKQAEGIIYVAAHERHIHCIPDKLSVPVVMAYGYTDNPAVPSVVVDEEDGARRIVQYLISQGHRSIGLICGDWNSIHTQGRLTGYQRALFENRLLFDPSLVCAGDWTREAGSSHTKRLLDKGVTAIFAMSDIIAGGVCDYLEQNHIAAGKDIAVAGYDDRELASYLRPPLTTMRIPLHDIGYTASVLALEAIGEERPGHSLCQTAEKKTGKNENTPGDESSSAQDLQQNRDRIFRQKCSLIIRSSAMSLPCAGT